MRNGLFLSLMMAGLASGTAHAVTFDVSDATAYEAAHRALAETLLHSMQAKGGNTSYVTTQLARHGREMALREVCASCEGKARDFGVDANYEPGVWLYRPVNSNDDKQALIAFPPAGDDSTWTQVDALAADGTWTTLDANIAPDVPVIVVRVNGALSFERQITQANELLQKAGLQVADARDAETKATTPTTRVESIRLKDDKEPWVSGAAEIYMISIGLRPANQPQIGITEMPYLDYDNTTYYPRQVALYWQDFAYGAADLLIYEHDDNTNYQQLVLALINAAGEVGNLAGVSQAQAIAKIVEKIVSVMPSGWFSNDDDYVDSFHTVLKTVPESRYGAAGNAQMQYIPFQLPSN